MIYSIDLTKFTENIKYLKQVSFKLAERVTIIEQYLSTLTERVTKGGVIVNGAFTVEKISPVYVTEAQLIDVYNNVPQILLKSSIIVELTADSFYHEQDDETICLEKDKNGKYWIIPTDKDTFWLVPSVDIRLNIYKLKTVRSLFNFCGDFPASDSNIVLIQPARMSILPNGQKWKLEEKGSLSFYNHHPTFTLSTKLVENLIEPDTVNTFLQEVQENYKKLELEIQQISEERNQFYSELKKYQADYQQLEAKFQRIYQERADISLQMDLIKMRLDLIEIQQSK